MMSKPPSELVLALRTALVAAAPDSAPVHLFALVDGALLLDLPKRAQQAWPASQALSLLTGATGAGAAEVGPLLFALSQEQVDAGLPDTLLDVKTGRSAGSFLVSSQSLSGLATCLARFVDVKLDDDSTMVMRFFDPRVLPFWLDMVQPGYTAHLAASASSWLYWDAQLALCSVGLHASNTPGAAATFPVRVSPEAEQKLLDDCYPFTLIERFRKEDANALERVPVKDRYTFFRDQLARARGHGVQSNGEIEAYCGLALELGPRFDEDSAMRPVLLKVKAGEKLLEALASVEDDDWARLKGHA